MSANSCPQNIWNHTDGCVCAPNGSVTAEADVDLDGGDLFADSPVNQRAAALLADPEFVETFPNLAERYADGDFLSEARGLVGQPLTLTVQKQAWDGRDSIDTGTADFDFAPVMTVMDEENRHAIAEDVIVNGLSNDEGDNLYIEARNRGLVEDHDGPFYVRDDSAFENDQIAAWDLANPSGDVRTALMAATSDLYSRSHQDAVNARRDLFLAEQRQERLALAKRLLDEDVPPGSTIALKIHGLSADENGACHVSLGEATDAHGNKVEGWRSGLRTPSKSDHTGATRYDAFLDDNDQDRINVDKVYAWVASGAPADHWATPTSRTTRSSVGNTGKMDTRITRVGERYERDGKAYEVVRVTPAGAAGTSHADGPTVHAKIVREDGTLSDFTADIWSGSTSYPASAFAPLDD